MSHSKNHIQIPLLANFTHICNKDSQKMENTYQYANLGQLSIDLNTVQETISKVVVGQDELIHQLLVALLADGHILIEGVPGVAKTLTARLLAETIDVPFSRIQFTPDLMPSDVLGTSVFNQKTTEFEFKKGPIFSNIVLTDEINRAPAKTQAALFECMQEKQITADGVTYPLENPFLVLATQNPIEQEGTYRLPEAQLDRFLMKIEVKYPSLDNEFLIIEGHHNRNNRNPEKDIPKVLSIAQINEYRQIISQIHIESNLMKYIAAITDKTRNHRDIFLGASPRASIAMLNCAKAEAALNNRDFVIPEDIQYVAIPIMRHRIQLTPEKEMEGITPDILLKELIASIEVPR
jgi:MoxR-like ATPase